MTDSFCEPAREAIEMLVTLGQHERRPALEHRLGDVIADALIARLVLNQRLIQSMELGTSVRSRVAERLEARRAHDHRVLERPRCGLSFRADPISYRAALHEDDWVVTVLPR